MSDKKFRCEPCDKYFQFKHQLINHNKSSKHKAVINGSAYQCNIGDCIYECNSKIKFRLHILNNHSTVEERKKGFKYYCEVCDTGRASKKEIETHLKTNKHKNMINESK